MQQHMHKSAKMWQIVIILICGPAVLSMCLVDIIMSCANNIERIEPLFGCGLGCAQGTIC